MNTDLPAERELALDALTVLDGLLGDQPGASSARDLIGSRRVTAALGYLRELAVAGVPASDMPDLGRTRHWHTLLVSVAGIHGCWVRSWGERKRLEVTWHEGTPPVTLRVLDVPGREYDTVSVIREMMGKPASVCRCSMPANPASLLGECPACESERIKVYFASLKRLRG